MNVTDADVAALTTQADHLMAAKMFSLACCVMLYYDILITFGDEVERIWKQRFSFATALWFMNRYLSPLGYVVVIVSFHDNWSKSVCNRYVLYPEVLKIFTSAAIGVIFVLRLYSVYGGSMFVLVAISVLLIAELAVKVWAFTDGTSVNLPPGLVGCILTGRSDSNDRFVFTWVAELVFDTIIFLATLSRTLMIYQRHRQGAAIPLIKIMMRDGIIYFLVIFAANVVTVTLFIALPPDLKAVNASFSTLITSLMVSRLILNLRNQAMRPRANVVSYPSSQLPPEQDRALTSTVIGNLGEPIESNWFGEGDPDPDDKDLKDQYDSEVDSRRETYAMRNLYGVDMAARKQQQHASSTISPGQILVEVTQTRSVTTDHVHTTSRTRDPYEYGYDEYGQRLGVGGPSAHPFAHPLSYSYTHHSDDLRSQRIGRAFSDDDEVDVEEGGSNSQGLSRGSRENGEPHPGYPDRVLLHSFTTGHLRSASGRRSREQEHLQEGDRRERRERQDRQDREEREERDYSEEGLVGTSEESTSYSFSLTDGARTEEEERQRRGRPGTSTSTSGGEGDNSRARVRMDPWRPPPTWLLENVDADELGKPRRSRTSRRRRPSTS